ncbi:hypothetical protein BDV41DRAFT_537642 [Aspergillus transmontanensis]|uniref:F-box domain-containing protein n=1 Tax=Aspergillus transmontanensis TaxID=1034304 RepID=A0A5N6VY32_9EURO|nr:hypothetical protein BDV41DRAFT_537642 [Aspergillus transmontanensis]
MGIATDLLTWVLSYMRIRSTPAKPSSSACYNLANLPAELLYTIADYLTPCDRACLSLCNRRLLHTFGYGPSSENNSKSIFPISLSLGLDSARNQHLLTALRQNTKAVNLLTREIRRLSRLIQERTLMLGDLVVLKTGGSRSDSHASSEYYPSPQSQSSDIHQV